MRAKDSLKLNNTINKLNLYYSLSLNTEKSCTFQFKDTSLDSVALNPLDILPRQN